MTDLTCSFSAVSALAVSMSASGLLPSVTALTRAGVPCFSLPSSISTFLLISAFSGLATTGVSYLISGAFLASTGILIGSNFKIYFVAAFETGASFGAAAVTGASFGASGFLTGSATGAAGLSIGDSTMAFGTSATGAASRA